MNTISNRAWTIYMHTFPNNKKYIGVAITNDDETPEQACLRRWGHDG